MTVMQIVQQLFGSMGITMEIFFVTLITSLILGLGLALIRMSKNPILSVIAKFYISVMRGTPLMLQLLVVYFGPFFIFGMQITPSYRLKAVLIGFALNYAAYFAEIYRGGIESMPIGQYEAAEILGYTKVQTFVKIIFPQVMKRILPSITNEVITLVKDTSIAYVLSVQEMFTVAKAISASQASVSPLIIAQYFTMCLTYRGICDGAH